MAAEAEPTTTPKRGVEIVHVNGRRCCWCDQPGQLALVDCSLNLDGLPNVGVMACEVCRRARREIGGG